MFNQLSHPGATISQMLRGIQSKDTADSGWEVQLIMQSIIKSEVGSYPTGLHQASKI